MITENEFLEQIRVFAHLKCLTIPTAAAKDVFPKFEEFSRGQLSGAIEDFENSDERFDFSKLLRRVRNKRADQIENQSERDRDEYAGIARGVFGGPLFSGECKQDQCRGCVHVGNCQSRGREWMKGITAILKGNLGRKGANELIDFMRHDFMGGIKS